jgi:hypothetical protein
MVICSCLRSKCSLKYLRCTTKQLPPGHEIQVADDFAARCIHYVCYKRLQHATRPPSFVFTRYLWTPIVNLLSSVRFNFQYIYIYIYIYIHTCLFISNFHLFIHQWLYSPLLGSGLFFSSVSFFTQTVGLLGWVIRQSQGRYLHTGQHKQNKRTHRHPSLEWNSNPRSQC